MLHAPQGLHAFFRAYYHYKSADWKGNKPHPLKARTAVVLHRPAAVLHRRLRAAVAGFNSRAAVRLEFGGTIVELDDSGAAQVIWLGASAGRQHSGGAATEQRCGKQSYRERASRDVDRIEGSCAEPAAGEQPEHDAAQRDHRAGHAEHSKPLGQTTASGAPAPHRGAGQQRHCNGRNPPGLWWSRR